MPPEINMTTPTIEAKRERLTETKSGMISIGCKHPSGIVLELDECREEAPTPGTQKVKVHYPTGARVVLNGSNSMHPDSPQRESGRAVGGYGITEVEENFWDRWVAQHPDFPMLKNNTLFALPTTAAVSSEANNRRDVKNGMEPMDPDKPAQGLARDTGRAI